MKILKNKEYKKTIFFYNNYTTNISYYISCIFRLWYPIAIVHLSSDIFSSLERKIYKNEMPDMKEMYITEFNRVTTYLKLWCEENCSGKVRVNNGFYIEFECMDDVILFKMTFS